MANLLYYLEAELAMAKKKLVDLHVYLSPDDLQNLKKAKAVMVSLGLPDSAINQQDVIRYALRKASELGYIPTDTVTRQTKLSS